jgi:hypothetical protein
MNDLDLDVAFHINGTEVDAATGATRERIRSVNAAARDQMGILERLRAAAAIYQRGMMEATREENIVKYNQRLQETNAQIARLTTLTNRPGSFNGLQNSINQMGRELPAFTYSVQTGFMAISNNIPILIDELGRLRVANAALAASGQTAVPVWRQFLTGLLSWQTAMVVGITLLTVYGKEIGNFFSSLFKGKEAINAAKMQLEDLNKAIAGTEYKKAITNLRELTINIDLAKRGLLDKTEVLDQYNKSIGKVTGQVANLDEAEKALVKNGEAYVKMMLYKAAANLALEEAAKKAVEAEQLRIKKAADFSTIGTRASVASVGQSSAPGFVPGQDPMIGFKARLKAAEDEKVAKIKIFTDGQQAQEDIAKNFQTKAAKIAAKNKFDFFGHQGDGDKKADSDFNSIINGRKSVLDRLSKLDDEYSRKSFTKDEEEKQALKDKFAQFRKIIIDENAKIDQYNKTHKKQIGSIDITAVDPIENNATADLVYRQSTEKLKVSLDNQKKLYKDYEDYKTIFGEAKANERYKNELDTSKTYLQAIAGEYTKLIIKQSTGTLTGPQQERLKMLDAAYKDEQKLTEANIVKLLADLQSFDDKRVLMQETAMAKIQELRKRGDTDEAERLRIKSEQELTEFDKKRVEQLDSYKDLFDNMDRLSTSALRKGLTSLQKEVGKLALTPKAKEFFDKVFGDANNKIESKSVADFKNIASALGEAARYAGQLDKGLGDALGVAADLAGQVVNIKQGIASFNIAKASKDTFGQISAGLGIFGSVLGVFSLIGGLFDHSAEMAKQREESLKREVGLIESVNKRMREQVELNKELLGDSRVKSYAKTMADIAVSITEQNNKLREQHYLTGNSTLDKQIQNNDPFGIGTDTLNKLRAGTSLLNKTEEEIKKLYDSGLLEDKAKAAYDSLVDLRQQQKDLLVEMNKELTGVDFSGVLDNFASIFDKAEPTVEDFAKFFEDTMQDAARAAFKRDVLEQSLKDWYNTFAEASKDGLSAAEKDTLQADYNRRVAEIQQKAKDLEQFTGVKLADAADTATSGSNSLQGAYKTASQASIDLLSANTGGLRLAAVEGNNLTKVGNATMGETLDEIKKHTLSLTEIRDYSKVIAENSAYLKHLESMDKKMDDNKNYAAGTGRII